MPSTHWIGDQTSPRAGLNTVGKKKSRPLPEIEPQFPGRPVRSLVPGLPWLIRLFFPPGYQAGS
jgi:hypothetical protein